MTTGLLTTTVGRAAIIADLGGGADLVLTHVAWGDANGVPYSPNEAQVTLVNERYRATIASVAVVGGAIVVDAVIPADTNDGTGRPSHGFSVAEVGLFNNAGTLIGVARCGNGYKPPPSSGQAHDVTYRLKLAVANPSAIAVVIDPVAQVSIGRHVRPFWLTVDGVLNDPPGAPALGATYVIGTAPTGAWAGFANRIAQWLGVWALATAPVGHQAVDSSKGRYAAGRWLEFTGAGWDFGLSRLLQRQPGNYAVAAGTANALSITLDPAPTAWADLIGVPLNILLTATNTGAATLAVVGLPGTKPILRPSGGALIPGDLGSGGFLRGMYDGTGIQMAGLTQTPGATTVVYNAPGTFTWTCPPGVFRVRVKAWGGGGGGGGATGAANSVASAGGGGEYREGEFAVTPGTNYTVIVGSGGTGGNNTPTNGGPGGSSAFGGLMMALGGGGGLAASGGIQATPGAGGSGGSGGVIFRSGMGGGIAYAIGSGQFVLAQGGPAFTSNFTYTITTATASNGAPGQFPGGGASGGALSGSGGFGAQGQVILEY